MKPSHKNPIQKTREEFIRFKITGIEKAIRGREQSAEAWRSGTDEYWRAVGSNSTKSERLVIAEMEEKIIAKLYREREMFKDVLETLEAASNK